jgi:replicative DNA helicase
MSTYNPRQNKKQTNDLSDFVFGKIQPQALALEEAVLGACLLTGLSAFQTVYRILVKESFYSETHQYIFDACFQLMSEHKPIDLLTVNEQLTSMGVLDEIGGTYKLIEITNRIGSDANIEYHCRIIAEKHGKREAISLGSAIIKEGYEDTSDFFDILDNYRIGVSRLEAIPSRIAPRRETNAEIAAKLMRELEIAATGELVGVPTGFTDFDKLTNGLQEEDYMLLAARPSMGKSMVMCQIMLNAAKKGKKVGCFSLEMSKEKIFRRMALSESGVSNDIITGRGFLTEASKLKYFKALEFIASLPIIIDDRAGITVMEMESQATRWKEEDGLDLIVADYAQLFSPRAGKNYGGNKVNAMTDISMDLKNVTKRLKTPLIALSQLSRAVETRGGNRKPQLSDLRETGAFEQDADIIGFIYRPEYYDIKEMEDGQSTKGVLEILIEKNREGALKDIRLFADMPIQRVVDFDSFLQTENEESAPFTPQINNSIERPKSNTDEQDLPF